MPNGDPKYDGIVEILRAHEFGLENIQTGREPSQVLFIKQRPGSPLVVTVPMDCTRVPDATIRQIMQTAQVSEPEYRHLLNTP